jgi:predicted site-specific integrase-resolvase
MNLPDMDRRIDIPLDKVIYMEKHIYQIPASRDPYTCAPLSEDRKRRVAAYARVSTDNKDQVTSYQAQIDYYRKYIQSHNNWELVHIYTDEGITGTSIRHREGFQTMISDALSGKIDLIITKSVSRFARNTVDCLTTIRRLKEGGVECFFQRENLWTFDGKGELFLTLMSSIAQEEGIKTPTGKDTWHAETIRHILTNEKYKGDALLQKTFTVDYLSKKRKINQGEIPQIYVEGGHEAIISQETFEQVRVEIKRRKKE